MCLILIWIYCKLLWMQRIYLSIFSRFNFAKHADYTVVNWQNILIFLFVSFACWKKQVYPFSSMKTHDIQYIDNTGQTQTCQIRTSQRLCTWPVHFLWSLRWDVDRCFPYQSELFRCHWTSRATAPLPMKHSRGPFSCDVPSSLLKSDHLGLPKLSIL